MKIATLYLNTMSSPNIVDRTNIASIRYNINWNEIFGDCRMKPWCRVKILMNSGFNAPLTTANVGSLRVSFTSNYSNTAFNAGLIQYAEDFVGNEYLRLDTTNSPSTISTPYSNDFYIQFLQQDGATLQTNLTEYQIWFYFEFDE